jgi:hypothetical protein
LNVTYFVGYQLIDSQFINQVFGTEKELFSFLEAEVPSGDDIAGKTIVE